MSTITTTYTVAGMSCDHCVASVTEEVSEVAGISNVDVDLTTGRLTVTSDSPVDDERVRAAVESAGYEITDNT